MSGSFRHDIAGGDGTLIVVAIQSPDYAAGSAGWQIKKDGSVEFNAGTFRGTITITQADGTILQINDEFITFYDSGSNVIGQVAVFDPANGGLALFGRNAAAPAEVSALYLIGDSAGSIVAPGPITANEPGQTAGTPETWHKITSGFPAGVSGQIAYTLLPDNWVGLDFQLAVTSGTSIGGGTFFASIPSAYYPTAPKMYDVQALEGSNWVPVSFDIDTGGNIHARNAGVTTITQLTGNARYPLGV